MTGWDNSYMSAMLASIGDLTDQFKRLQDKFVSRCIESDRLQGLVIHRDSEITLLREALQKILSTTGYIEGPNCALATIYDIATRALESDE